MKIKSVRDCGEGQTYDLEVAHPEHQFFCNGILTSNSHSDAYTYTSFREYWLKLHYDPEFNISLLNNTAKAKESKGESVISQYITQMMKKGYKILLPSVNMSEGMFSLGPKNEIIWGLSWLKGISEEAQTQIIKNRSENGVYTSLKDLYDRIGKKIMNKRVVEALIWSGAFDEFISAPSSDYKKNIDVSESNIQDRYDLHEYMFKTLRGEKKYEQLKKSLKDIIERENEVNNISMTEISIFQQVRNDFINASGENVNYLWEVSGQGAYLAVGKVEKVENKQTKTKKDYKRITLRDDTHTLNGIFLWPWKCKNVHLIKKGDFIAAKIEIDEAGFVNLVRFSKINDDEDDE